MTIRVWINSYRDRRIVTVWIMSWLTLIADGLYLDRHVSWTCYGVGVYYIMNIIRIYRILASSLPTKDEILQNVCSLFPYNFASLQVEIGSLVDNLKAISKTKVASILVSLFFLELWELWSSSKWKNKTRRMPLLYSFYCSTCGSPCSLCT